jgi:hypothetical protein
VKTFFLRAGLAQDTILHCLGITGGTLKKQEMHENNQQGLQEGADFYYTDEGYLVFTEAYHLKRGYCCRLGCRHCPWRKRERGDGRQVEDLK